MIENRYSVNALPRLLGSLRIIDPSGTVEVHDIVVGVLPAGWLRQYCLDEEAWIIGSMLKG